MNLNKQLITETNDSYIYLIPEHSLMWIEFKDFYFIDEDEYKEVAKAVLAFVKERGIKKMLFNTQKLNAVFSVDLQKWIAENINKELLQILDKVAVIEPENHISSMSLQQYVEESILSGSKSKELTFKDVDKALEWLIKD